MCWKTDICWYAKEKGIVSIVISSVILGIRHFTGTYASGFM